MRREDEGRIAFGQIGQAPVGDIHVCVPGILDHDELIPLIESSVAAADPGEGALVMDELDLDRRCRSSGYSCGIVGHA